MAESTLKTLARAWWLFGLLVLLGLLAPGRQFSAAVGAQAVGAQADESAGPGSQRLYGLGLSPADRLSAQQAEELGLVLAGPARQAPEPRAPADVDWFDTVFYSARDDNWEIYWMDGEWDEVRLTDSSSADVQPRLNPGSTLIAYASDRSDDWLHIYTMLPDGSGWIQLTSGDNDNYDPNWSPDGEKIVFKSYRDNQSEIYTINAAGGGLTRLTNYYDYDGQPAFSPDGSRIAYISRHSNSYTVNLMNADGSGVVQLVEKHLSAHPAWSPDGSQIAFDADGDYDDFQEIWLMNADGSNRREVYDPGGQTDAYVSGWYPDGSGITFTSVSWILYDGDWYWTNAYLLVYQIAAGTMRSLGSGGQYDWAPHQQPADPTPPETQFLPLEAESGFYVALNWAQVDGDDTPLKGYDLQVRDDPAGSWTDLAQLLPNPWYAFEGLGGHTYYFRVRAQDVVGNIEPWPADYDAATTIESQPPVTTIQPLPAYTRSSQVTLSWNAVDVGGSGIKDYDVQVRDLPNGSWTDWLTGYGGTSTTLVGTVGHTYSFRVRATDLALNVAPWPPDGACPQTTLYSWSISGRINDSTGLPVAGAQAQLASGSLLEIPSDYTGYYRSFSADFTSPSVSWSKPGYGSRPATRFDYASDAELDIHLPPADNQLADPDFESGGWSASSWQAGGDVIPVFSDIYRHTGEYGVTFGPQSQFQAPVALADMAYFNLEPVVFEDARRQTHVVWAGLGSQDTLDGLYESVRTPTGDWLAPQQIKTTVGYVFDFAVLLSADQTEHAVWSDGSYIYYSQRGPDSSWTAPMSISGPADQLTQLELLEDSNGRLHLVYFPTNLVFHQSYSASSGWSAPVQIAIISGSTFQAQAVLAPDQTLIVCWNVNIYDINALYCTKRTPAGSWNGAQQLDTNHTFGYALAVDQNNLFHLIWFKGGWSTKKDLHYSSCPSAGYWSAAQTISPASYMNLDPALVGNQTGLHVVWSQQDEIAGQDSYLQYLYRSPAGQWSAPQPIVTSLGSGWHWLATDDQDQLYLVWRDLRPDPSAGEVYFQLMDRDGNWYCQSRVTYDAQDSYPRQLYFEPVSGLHLLTSSANENDLNYTQPQTPSMEELSSLTQAVSLPETLVNPSLSFLYQVVNAVPATTAAFEVLLQSGGLTTTLFSVNEYTPDWSHQWFDLSSWAGQTITLTFQARQAAGEPYLLAALDEVSLGSAFPNLAVAASSSPQGMPRDSVTFTLIYRNRGRVAAHAAQLSLALPPDLTFVAASLPPAGLGSTLTWELGDLPPESGPYYLTVTVNVAPGAAPLSTLEAGASLTSAGGELETADNTALVWLFVGYRARLPLVR